MSSFNTHVRCEMKVAPLCSRVKNVSEKKARSISDPSKHSPKILTDLEKSKNEKKAVMVSGMELDTGSVKDSQSSLVDECSKPAIEVFVESPTAPPAICEEPALDRLEIEDVEISAEKNTADMVYTSKQSPLSIGSLVQVLYNYNGTNSEEVTVREGETATVIKPGI